MTADAGILYCSAGVFFRSVWFDTWREVIRAGKYWSIIK
jgi:hypothetical protein